MQKYDKYIIQAKKNNLNKPATIKYYPQAAPTTPLTLSQIMKLIEKRTTVSSADVKAVLDALQYEVIDALQNGNSVRLGDIGSFRLTIKAEGADTAADAKRLGANLIKEVSGSSQRVQPCVMLLRRTVLNSDCKPMLPMPRTACRKDRKVYNSVYI